MPQKNMIPLIIIGCLAQIALLSGYYYFFMEPEAPIIRPTSAAFSEGDMWAFNVHNKPNPLPALSFLDEYDNKISLSDFQGKVILLNVWASWCGPCRSEMRSLDNLQSNIGSSDFEVVALNIDQSGSNAGKKFLDQMGIENLDFYHDQPNYSKRALGVRALPATLILNTRGEEVGRLVGAARWNSKDAVNLIEAIQNDEMLN